MVMITRDEERMAWPIGRPARMSVRATHEQTVKDAVIDCTAEREWLLSLSSVKSSNLVSVCVFVVRHCSLAGLER